MIPGSVRITPRAVETHRNTYRLDQLSVVAICRPFLPGALIFAVGGAGFAVAFGDLLYPHEIVVLACGLAFCLACGLRIGQIRLLSRDLRGSELACMIWGSYGHLARLRAEIVTAMNLDAPGEREITAPAVLPTGRG